MTAPHHTHEWPEEIGIGTRCLRCGVLRGHPDAPLRCDPPVFVDEPAAVEREPPWR